MDTEKIKTLSEWLIKSRFTLALTGAGISKASGIPPFRGEDGIWNKYDPRLLELNYFHLHPLESWKFMADTFFKFMEKAKPNPTHFVLAELEEMGYLGGIITQNIDCLHEAGGSKKVWEYHGGLDNLICTSCGDVTFFKKLVLEKLPPICTKCNGLLKPKIIFFIVICIITCTILSSVVLVAWSLTWQWRFPDFLPAVWTLKLWAKGLASSFDPVKTTLFTGMASAFLGLVLTIGCLEHDVNSRKNQARQNKTPNYTRYIHYFLYLPLLVPQITFMAGIQLLLVIMKMDGYWITLMWSHLLFVLPYMFIALSATYLAFDRRVTDQAMLLGRSYTIVLFKIKLPMLLRPVLFSFAIGFSVSVAQYIPTMLVGAGRFSTITTEVVSIASGSDRRAIAVYALIQQFLPMIMYALAILIPKILYYNRKGMQV